MSEKNHISEMEQQFRDQLNGFTAPPPPQVWSGIESQFPAASASTFTKLVEWFKSGWMIKSAAIIGTVATIAYFTAVESTPENVESTQEVVPTEDVQNQVADKQTIEVVNPTDGQSDKRTIGKGENPTSFKDSKQMDNSALVRTNSGTAQQQSKNTTDSPSADIAPSQNQSMKLTPDDTTICEGDRFSVRLSHTEAVLTCWYLNGERTSIRKRSFPVTGSEKQLLKVSADVIRYGEVMKLTSTVHVVQRPTQVHSERVEKGYRLTAPGEQVIWTTKNGLTTGSAGNTLVWSRQEPVYAFAIEQGCTTKLEFVPPPVEAPPIKWINIPNVFTPNNDGLNDNYVIEVENASTINLVITDLNNNIVYRTNSPEEGWNGRHMDSKKPCDSGKYVVQIVAIDKNGKKETRTTSLLLVRDN